MKKCPPGADDIEPPSGPIFNILADFKPQLGDRKQSLSLRALQVVDFDPRIVDDLFMIVHEVKEAAHDEMNHQLG